MKKFAITAVAIAAGALAAGSALAGSISAPVTPTTFAVEALSAVSPLTAVTTPTIVYTMGVGRPVGNGFTIINNPSSGSTFGTCVLPVYAGPSTVSITLKRQSAGECAYDVQVAAAAVTVGDTFTWTGQTFATHPLATAGSSISVSINLKDPGETAQVDNASAITKTIANSAQSVNVYAAASDTATVADVNAAGGPLTGFVANATVPADTASVAAANLTFDNNSINAKNPNGATNFDFTATTGTASVVLTGTTGGAATNGFCLDVNNNGTLCEVGERFTLTSTTATLASIASGNFPAQGSTATRKVSFQADGTTQLGTSRTFALSGTVTPQVGAAEPLADTNAKNATSWVWSANASQLMTPYFTTNSLFLSRVFFLNTGTSAVGYTATCYAETGNNITYGAAKTGTLSANGQTSVNMPSVCTFSGNTRGAVIFTINAPINTVKGSYQTVDPVTLNNALVPMTRPYNQANTTE
jgi:hypothetical protein